MVTWTFLCYICCEWCFEALRACLLSGLDLCYNNFVRRTNTRQQEPITHNLFPFSRPANFSCVPFSLASSPLSESLEQSRVSWITDVDRLCPMSFSLFLLMLASKLDNSTEQTITLWDWKGDGRYQAGCPFLQLIVAWSGDTGFVWYSDTGNIHGIPLRGYKNKFDTFCSQQRKNRHLEK